MDKPFKPAKYNSISPYFIVNGAQKFLELLKSVFHAQELRRYNLPDGKIIHAEVMIDDSVIMFADATEKYPPIPLVVHVYVPDVDKTFQRAVQAGCEIIDKPRERENDPDRRGVFKDYGGNFWTVATQL